jgi:hypothetical protein
MMWNRPSGLAVMVGLVMLLAGCAQPSAVPQSPVATPRAVVSTPTVTPAAPAATEEPEIGQIMRQVLMQQLGAEAGEIEIVEVEAVEWSDACLGIASPEILCAAVITPGYRVVLATRGQEYVYHTDASGGHYVLAEGPEARLDAPLLTWEAAPGDECRTLRAGSDAILFGPCQGPAMDVGYAVAERRVELDALAAQFAPFDAMTPAGSVRLAGEGSVVATPSEQRMVGEWARQLTLEAESGRTGASWGLAFAWHREGGIAGFCDDVSAYVTGQVYVASCRQDPPVTTVQRRLTAEELEKLYSWIDTVAPFEFKHADPAAADGMTLSLVFSGAGDRPVSEAERQAILDFAGALAAGS